MCRVDRSIRSGKLRAAARRRYHRNQIIRASQAFLIPVIARKVNSSYSRCELEFNTRETVNEQQFAARRDERGDV
jgi:hypothetical protein